METVLVRALESTVFGHESPEKPCKSSKKSVSFCLGARCRRFESCHSDQKRENSPSGCFLFFAWCVNSALFCKAKAGSHTIGITKRSVVTLSFRPKKSYHFDTTFFIHYGVMVYLRTISVCSLNGGIFRVTHSPFWINGTSVPSGSTVADVIFLFVLTLISTSQSLGKSGSRQTLPRFIGGA